MWQYLIGRSGSINCCAKSSLHVSGELPIITYWKCVRMTVRGRTPLIRWPITPASRPAPSLDVVPGISKATVEPTFAELVQDQKGAGSGTS